MNNIDHFGDHLVRLIDAHPALFENRPLMESDLAGGWYDIVDKLCADIVAELGSDASRRVHILQIKQKFGMLRIYARINPSDDALGQNLGSVADADALQPVAQPRSNPIDEQARSRMAELIGAAESASVTVCEVCSAPGTRRMLVWRKTLCDRHFEVGKRLEEDFERWE